LPGYTPTARDRHFLSAYFSPVCDPDMLIPGPVIQRRGAIGHYPNGEIDHGEMIIAYSYSMKPRAIYASRVKNLPDFTSPFFLKRESRPEVVIDQHRDVAYFPETFSSLGLVLTKELVDRPSITLEFTVKLLTMPCFYPGMSKDEAVNGITLLTIGALDHNNTAIRVTGPLQPYKLEFLRRNKWEQIAQVGWPDPLSFTIRITETDYSVRFGSREDIVVQEKLLRKICFGGFYTDPVAYPSGGTFELDLKAVKVY
jgi:hypothetical protein